MVNRDRPKLVNKKWRTVCILLIGTTCFYFLSSYFNRATYNPKSNAKHIVNSTSIISYDERDFLIVLISDSFPNATETAVVEAENNTLKIYFKVRSSLFPEIPFGKSKNTFGNLGDWDHVFAFEVSDDINTVKDMQTGFILWQRTQDN